MSDQNSLQAIENVFIDLGDEVVEFDPKGHYIHITDPHKLYKTINKTIMEAKIDARNKLLNKLVRTYSKITPPISSSPLELTDEAKAYNRFVTDLYKFVDIEIKKHEQILIKKYGAKP